jgi:alkanesulfonate monooxygenase SsuD/methylene tetrahydromethanopterin reductase-like flavin-dependent oxidoreductase (luciferase family)
MTLSHAAAVTERVRLATCVIPLTCHHPIALAKDAATVDCLSGGRLELGVGAGWLKEEAALLGLPDDHLGPRLVESIEVMRAAWSESPFSYEGEYWSVPGAHVRPAPVQGTDLPIWIGGLGPGPLKALELYGTGLVMPRALAPRLAEVRAKIGPAKRLSVGLKIGIDFDPSEVEESIASLVEQGADQVHLVCGETAADVVACMRGSAERVLDRVR